MSVVILSQRQHGRGHTDVNENRRELQPISQFDKLRRRRTVRHSSPIWSGSFGFCPAIHDEPQIYGTSSPGGYSALYIEQLTELVTMTLADGTPIDLFEVWLDGTSGSDTVQNFKRTGLRDVIRQRQPDEVMWGH
ncbi:glycoside hydrolase [Apiospora saccharicola]|uniref:Glycoside hydrolase n=1 Tax=Apiospora saccharicola TaxID=335842 RepID=A0ABR1U5K6_9PEZI